MSDLSRCSQLNQSDRRTLDMLIAAAQRRHPQCDTCDGVYLAVNAWRGESRVHACDQCGREMTR